MFLGDFKYDNKGSPILTRDKYGKQSNHPQSKGSLDMLINGSMVRIFFSQFLDEEYVKRACVDLSKKNHDYYFGSYSNFYIHEEMLKDTVRTRAY